MMTLTDRLATRPDAERIRLRLGTAFIENIDSLWPQGVPEDATPEFIRDNLDGIVAVLDQMVGRDANVRRLPRRLHWLLWLLDELEETAAFDG
jgi:hypothetical protein